MHKFYQIVDKAGELEIRFYGDIVMDEMGKWTKDDTCPSDIIDTLQNAGDKPLSIRINSGGGSVFGGIAIYNVLKHKGYKACLCGRHRGVHCKRDHAGRGRNQRAEKRHHHAA